MSLLDRLVLQGDCIEVMRGMEENSVDAMVTDPPYDLLSGSRRGSGRSNEKEVFGRHGARGGGFMGLNWDSTGVAFDPETWRVALRVLKPGGYLLVFGGPRTFHRVACAVEDAEFEIREVISWLYGSGFPKSKNLGFGVGSALKPAWEPITLARRPLDGTLEKSFAEYGTGGLQIDVCRIATTDKLGGGAELNVQSDKPEGWDRPWRNDPEAQAAHASRVRANVQRAQALGRFPANVVLTHYPECVQVGTRIIKGDPRETGNGKRGSGFVDVGADSGDAKPNAPVYGDQEIEAFDCHPDCPVRLLDEQTRTLKKGGDLSGNEPSDSFSGPVYGDGRRRPAWQAYGDSGGASRFFYCSKASTKERSAGLDERNPHPTVKPVALMRWLTRLVTPPDGLILDPFVGSGTTGVAAIQEGFRFVGIEQDASYCDVARRRIEHAAQELEREEIAA